jgi:hypothetical protein
MKDKIWDILENVRQGYITANEGPQQVLDLFAVSGSCEWCGTTKQNPNGLCRECGRFPSPSNYR